MSVYSAEFGGQTQQRDTSETAILKYKKFSEIPLAVILSDEAKTNLDKWLALGDLEIYQESVLQCLRSLFALVKTRSVAKTSYSNQFQYNKALVAPVERIDKRLFAKTTVPTNKGKPKCEEQKVEAPPKEEKAQIAHTTPVDSSLLKPNAIRGELLKGNGYITASCFVPEKVSSYQAQYKNPIGATQVHKIKFDTHTSMATGGVCPDPLLIRKAIIEFLLEKMNAVKEQHIKDTKSIQFNH